MMLSTLTIALLLIGNIFMTFAWYWYLKYENYPLHWVLLISWFLAFFEYCFTIPATRIGIQKFNVFELKMMQEVITLVVFCFFAMFYLHHSLKWNYIVGFILMVMATFFVFNDWKQ